jgi:hypothetical protein
MRRAHRYVPDLHIDGAEMIAGYRRHALLAAPSVQTPAGAQTGQHHYTIALRSQLAF